MSDLNWLLRRMRAMSIAEIVWRIMQKSKEKNEKRKYNSKEIEVTSSVFFRKYERLQIDTERMRLNWDNQEYSLNRKLPLLGEYDYDLYYKEWSAGFQTDNKWENIFSYELSYKQRDEIGDARTNWELNRHFQFAMLAKNYYVSHKKEYLDEFIELFESWNHLNPFLHGISWTSVMEVAIRTSNWCFAYCFLNKSKDVSQDILKKLKNGIINMTCYITEHYSRYSSANNHLIVEAYAIGQTGILVGYKPWIDLSIKLLTKELPIQNYSDGINKELSLHYQSFYMEAMGLMMRLMLKNDIEVPKSWYLMLSKMAEYLANCMGIYGEVIEFGDNDEGKILDLQGGYNHYKYVLELMGCLLQKKYCSSENMFENISWLFTDLDRKCKRESHTANKSISYAEGGNTILKSTDGHILIGIDHAELGFGSIAAHGHADALSFQMYVFGFPIFIDPGTYIYHCDISSRNAFRKTENHNTVCIDGKNQSEMIGAFLWGKRANCKLLKCEISEKESIIEVAHDGYAPIIHNRRFHFCENVFTIEDVLINAKGKKAVTTFVLSPQVNLYVEAKTAKIEIADVSIFLESSDLIEVEKSMISVKYGCFQETKVLKISFYDNMMTKIVVN